VKNLCGLYKDDFDSGDLNRELDLCTEELASNNFGWGSRNSRSIAVVECHLNYGRPMQSAFVNVCIAIRIFLTMPVTVASTERSFSKLKLVKNYLRFTMKQERLAIMSIAYDTANWPVCTSKRTQS